NVLVTGNTTLNGNVYVSGTTTLVGNELVSGNVTVTGVTRITSTGTANQAIIDQTSARLVSADGTQSVAVNNTNTTITAAAGHTVTVDSTTTTINGSAKIYAGSTTNTNNIIVDSTSSRMVSADGYTSSAISNSTYSVVVDSDASNLNAQGALNITPTTASLLVNNNSTGIAHGISIGQTSTVISGGTHSTSLTLDDTGATFANTTTGGGPARVTGVADGASQYDAVNFGQLQGIAKKSYGGIASVAAMANIPAPAPGHDYSIGIGYGNYLGEDAYAFGAKAIVGKNRNITLSASIGVVNKTPTTGVGASYSF
ncbi:MAG: YadA-like family protein, partial [Candidatus Omnitrophica bacterium]|nr:YadA-like family protein [Candidatus Omnitrophota bacterium]